MQGASKLTHVLTNRQSANKIQLRPGREDMVDSEDQIRVSVVVQGGGSFATMTGYSKLPLNVMRLPECGQAR